MITSSSCVGSLRIFLMLIGPCGVISTGLPVVGSVEPWCFPLPGWCVPFGVPVLIFVFIMSAVMWSILWFFEKCLWSCPIFGLWKSQKVQQYNLFFVSSEMLFVLEFRLSSPSCPLWRNLGCLFTLGVLLPPLPEKSVSESESISSNSSVANPFVGTPFETRDATSMSDGGPLIELAIDSELILRELFRLRHAARAAFNSSADVLYSEMLWSEQIILKKLKMKF